MENVYVVGVSMTPFGKFLEMSVKELTRRALEGVLLDAGCQRSDIQAAFFANSTQGHMEGQNCVRGEIALRNAGLHSIPMVNVENACATGSSAFNLALQYLRAGEGDITLAIGAEKMYSPDRAKMFGIFDTAWDVHTVEQNKATVLELGAGVTVPPNTTSPSPYSVFMDVYAAFARAHMRQFGTTQEQIAAVAAKNHQHSVHNDRAQFRKSFTVAEVLAAPPITYPFTVPMCSPISDGASAAILCTESALHRYGFDRKRAMRVYASVIHTGRERTAEQVDLHLSAVAAKKAYEKAGVGPEEMSVAEVHDATAVGEIIQIENLGLCAFGEGGPMSARGDTTIGGRIPVNPSGGLESKGHPIGVTGLGQIYELVTQLRGEAEGRQVDNPRFAIAENGGGLYGIEEAVCCLTILGK